uniref:Putative RNA dependent RNA polymerase n=1 Tax=Zhupengkeng virus TaxID=2656665 RepID=A0A5P8PNZ8_9VIRU|nr:MAG: putative RNA dependent RNA polymerase [Zhupengkeng virus]
MLPVRRAKHKFRGFLRRSGYHCIANVVCSHIQCRLIIIHGQFWFTVKHFESTVIKSVKEFTHKAPCGLQKRDPTRVFQKFLASFLAENQEFIKEYQGRAYLTPEMSRVAQICENIARDTGVVVKIPGAQFRMRALTELYDDRQVVEAQERAVHELGLDRTGFVRTDKITDVNEVAAGAMTLSTPVGMERENHVDLYDMWVAFVYSVIHDVPNTGGDTPEIVHSVVPESDLVSLSVQRVERKGVGNFNVGGRMKKTEVAVESAMAVVANNQSETPVCFPVKPSVKQEVVKVGKSPRTIYNVASTEFLALKSLEAIYKEKRGVAAGTASGEPIEGAWAEKLARVITHGLAEDPIDALEDSGIHFSDKTTYERYTIVQTAIVYLCILLVRAGSDIMNFKGSLAAAFANYVYPYVSLRGDLGFRCEGAVPSGSNLTSHGNTHRHRQNVNIFTSHVEMHDGVIGLHDCCKLCQLMCDSGFDLVYYDESDVHRLRQCVLMGDDFIACYGRLAKVYDVVGDKWFGSKTKAGERQCAFDNDEAAFLQRVFMKDDCGNLTTRAVRKRDLGKSLGPTEKRVATELARSVSCALNSNDPVLYAYHSEVYEKLHELMQGGDNLVMYQEMERSHKVGHRQPEMLSWEAVKQAHRAYDANQLLDFAENWASNLAYNVGRGDLEYDN